MPGGAPHVLFDGENGEMYNADLIVFHTCIIKSTKIDGAVWNSCWMLLLKSRY